MPACPRCGEDNPERARFCLSCGSALTAEPSAEERKLVTMLFADVTGSTSLAERLDPERLKEVMGAFFQAMRREVEAEGGVVEKFIGDAVMAAFGVPTAHEDDPARALRAALRMRRRLDQLNDGFRSTYGLDLRIRIGVNTGEVVAVSSPDPGLGMVTGDPVNVAARLEQAAQPGQVLVSERTARSTRGFEFEPIGPVELRGKGSPVRAFALVGMEPGSERGQERGVPGLRSPMVGRDSELSLLTAVYDGVVGEGRPRLVTIYGDPGVGKSRLADEFVARMAGRTPPPTVLTGRCLPYGEGVTYWPLAEILKDHAGVFDTDPPEIALEKITALGRSLLTSEVTADPARATAALVYTVGLKDPGSPFETLPPRQTAIETHAAWRSFFSALGLAGPVVVVVEDIHWADAALLDLLEDLANRAQGSILFVCPARPELTDRRPAWGGGQKNFSSIFLEPLSAQDSGRLVASLLAVEDLPDDVHRRILERAEGNPFFLEEIVRQLIDEGHIVRAGDRWRAGSAIADVEIPDTVQAVLAARLDLLEAAEKRALQMAAVVGRVFWSEPVERLVPEDQDGLDQVLDRLEERDLVLSHLGSSMAGRAEFAFKHILTRDVAYGSLPRRQRVRAHHEVAEWIEEVTGERRREFIELLAHHDLEAFLGAKDDPLVVPEEVESLRKRAFASTLLASQTALGKGVLARAADWGERAASVASSDLERSMALEAVGTAAMFQGQGNRAWAALREAADAGMRAMPDDHRAIARLCGQAVMVPTRWYGSMTVYPTEPEVQRYFDLGMANVGEGDSEELAALLTARALWHHAFLSEATSLEQLEEARRAGERAVEIARRLGRPDLEVAALDGVCNYYLVLGQYGREMEIILDRLAIIERSSPDPLEVHDVYFMAAWTALPLGRYRDMLAFAEEGIARFRDMTGSLPLGIVAWRAEAKCLLGDWAGFFQDMASMEERLADGVGELPAYLSYPFAMAAVVHQVQGHPELADRYIEIVDRVEHRLRRHFPERVPPFRTGLLAVALARRGDVEEARKRLVTNTLPLLREWEAMFMQCRLDVAAELGDWQVAPRLVAEARAIAAADGLGALPLFADRLEGRTALATGDPIRAADLLSRAGRGLADLGAAWEAACTDLWAAEAMTAAGRPDEARDRMNGAVPVLERLSSVRELARAKDLLALL